MACLAGCDDLRGRLDGLEANRAPANRHPAPAALRDRHASIRRVFRRAFRALAVLVLCSVLLPVSSSVRAQSQPSGRPPGSPPPLRPPTRADVLRGDYGRYRANNDLLAYRLDIRVDPGRKFISGTNSIRFRMLQDDTRIQLKPPSGGR
jgi:hypothetical protein